MSDDANGGDEAQRALTRRNFLLGAAGVTGVAVAAGVGSWPAVATAAPDDPGDPNGPDGSGNGGGFWSRDRSYVSGNFALQLDGVNCGLLQKVEGGDIEAIVINQPPRGNLQKKQLGNLKYNDFKLQLDLTVAQPLRDWIEASLQSNFLRKSGQINAADFKRDIRQVREFSNAVVTGITFPGGDGSAKDAAYLGLNFSPEVIRNKPGSGKLDTKAAVKQKLWFPANFRLTIDGLEKACAKISRFHPLVLQPAVADPNQPGDKVPGRLEYPNLSVTLPEDDAQPFYDWFEDFAVRGNNSDAQERGATLQYLDTDGRTVLLTLIFQGLGIFKGTADALENNKDAIRRVKFDMYMEQLTVGKWG